MINIKKSSTVIVSLSAFILSLFLIFSNSAISQNYDYSSVSVNFSFNRDLSTAAGQNRGQDVSYLQCILGITPTGYFGNITKSTLTKFQNDLWEEILKPAGLSEGQATGFMGASTRKYINKRIAEEGTTDPTCGVGVTGAVNSKTSTNTTNNKNTSQNCPQGYNCTPAQQQGQFPGLTAIPSFGSNPGGPRLQNPAKPYDATTNPYVDTSGRIVAPPPQPPEKVTTTSTGENQTMASVNSQVTCLYPNHINYTTGQCETASGQLVCVSPQYFNSVTGTCENQSLPDTVPAYSSATCLPPEHHINPNTGECEDLTESTNSSTSNTASASDPTFFGGLAVYNSLKDQSWQSPCRLSEPEVYMVMVNNSAASIKDPSKPILNLLVKIGTTKLHGTVLANPGPPLQGMCLTGHIEPNNTFEYLNAYCQDYTWDGRTQRSTAWRVDGLITNFQFATGSACVPASS